MGTFWVFFGIVCGLSSIVLFNEIRLTRKYRGYFIKKYDLVAPRCHTCPKHDKDNPCYDESCDEAQKHPMSPEKAIGEIEGQRNMTPEEIRERDMQLMKQTTTFWQR